MFRSSRSSSGPPRKQIQELIVYLHCVHPNAHNFQLRKLKCISLYKLNLSFVGFKKGSHFNLRPTHNQFGLYRLVYCCFCNWNWWAFRIPQRRETKQLLDLFSWWAWEWPTRSKHVALTHITFLFVSVINQLDTQNFCFTVSLFRASTCFEHMCPSSGVQNCITQPLVFILIINQFDGHNFCFTISLFHACTCFEHMCSSSGGQNCVTQPLVSSHL